MKVFALVALAAMALVSCQKEVNHDDISKNGIDVTIIAGNPVTRTVLGEDGETPYWKDGDALSVTNGTSSNVEFTENSIAEGATSAIATFSGKVSAAGDYYAVYPHTGSVTDGKGPRVTIPTEQHPTATSFDGAADIMVSKKFSVGVTTSTTIDNLQFARCGAILQIVFSGKASAQQNQLANQHPVSVSLTAENDLVGNVLFDYENGTAYISSTPSKTVSASYTNSTQYAINGTNATYLLVVPTTLTGSLEVAATTEDYEISRTLTLPEDGIELEAGKIYTFNVKLGANSISDATPAQALPWSHDFSWHNSTTESNYTTDIEEKSSGEFTSGSYVYGAKEAGAIRIGNSSNPGSITSKLLNLSDAFIVTVSAKAFNTGDNAKITVNVGDITKTAVSNLTSNYVDYEFEFAAGDGTSKSPIIIGSSQKRAVITSVSVVPLTPKVATPTFSPAAGNVEANTEVTISCETEGATIYYTTDGSTPTTESTTGSSVTITETTTIKAIAVKNGYRDSDVATATYSVLGQPESLPYNNTLINGHVGFTVNDISLGGLSAVWTDTNYGIQANGYNCKSDIESYAESPLIDLTEVENVKLSFTHGIAYFADVATAMTQTGLEVRKQSGTWQTVTIPTYPETLGNNTADATVDLSSFAGEVIQFRFKYLATTTKPGRWQIKNVKVEEIVPVTLSSISVSGQTTSFTQGGTFVFGGTVTAHYSDNTTADVTASAEFSGYDLSTKGEQTVSVSYTEEGITVTTSYIITVSEPSSTTTATIKFGYNDVKINAATVTGSDDKNNTWTIATEGTTSFTNNNGTGFSQVGSGSKPATSITFTTTLPETVNKVDNLSIKLGGFSGTQGDVTLKVGNTTVGTGSLDGTNDVNVTSTSSADGRTITISVSNISKGVKVYFISAEYE